MPARPARPRWSAQVAATLGAAGLAVLLGVAPASAATTPATPTPASPSSAPADVAPTGEACPEGEGATVVVDPQGLTGGELDGPTAACAEDPADGLSALTEAGFEVTEVSPGYICTIAGVPTPEQADCEQAGYWSYWYAPRDGEWTLSDVGAAARTPEPGSVDAWSWTDGVTDATPPRLQPAAVAELPVAGTEGTPSPTAGTSASPAPSASAGAGAQEDGGASDAAVEDVAEDGPPVGTIAVVAVLVVLVVVGGLLAARRRQRDLDEHGPGGPDAP